MVEAWWINTNMKIPHSLMRKLFVLSYSADEAALIRDANITIANIIQNKVLYIF